MRLTLFEYTRSNLRKDEKWTRGPLRCLEKQKFEDRCTFKAGVDAYPIWPSATFSECRLGRDGKTGGVLLITISDISSKWVELRTCYEASVGRHFQCPLREVGAPVSPKQHE